LFVLTIYVGALSDFVVSSSKIIYQAWHEHLPFTKAYRGFCTGVPAFLLTQPGANSHDLLNLSPIYVKQRRPASLESKPLLMSKFLQLQFPHLARKIGTK
jgi:hypothetical protein